jgi:immune inhibitor A
MDSTRRNRNLIIAGVAVLVLMLCTATVGAAGVVAFMMSRPMSDGQTASVEIIEQPARVRTPTAVPLPTPKDAKPSRTTPEPAQNVPIAPEETGSLAEAQLSAMIVPTRDLRDLALRLRPGLDDVPLIVSEEPHNYAVGDRETFWVSNMDTNTQSQITAELIYKTDVVYAWVEVDHEFDLQNISRSIDAFSEESVPKVREFFGSEWSPGVDGDERLHILHATGMGSRVAGYYSSADQFSSLANEYSNQKEMFYISLEWLNRSRDYQYYETVLAHEFQHMVHWYNDRNEETWVNEGMSELAQEIAGYPPDTGFATIFASVPDTQLNTWNDGASGNGEHYGSSYLFMAYLLQRFGEDATKAVVAHEANGVLGVPMALQEVGFDFSFEELFADWVVANYVDDPEALGELGRFGYQQLAAPQPAIDEVHRRFPVDAQESTVRNFGADYIALRGDGDITLHFDGETEARLADVAAYSGDWMWWSNRADDSNSRLTRAFDFTEVEPGDPIEMEIRMWFDIETDYDYGYVVVSRDGEKWTILPGRQTTTENPSGNSFGHAYTDRSQGAGGAPVWITERFDLSDYAGETVFVRLEYVTDDAVNAPGWFVDDIRIDAIDYATDFEDGADEWESEGWLLTDNRLDQRWLLQVLILDGDELVDVHRVDVNDEGEASVNISSLGGNDEAILIISGVTPFTTEVAAYRYWIDQR